MKDHQWVWVGLCRGCEKPRLLKRDFLCQECHAPESKPDKQARAIARAQ